MNMKMSRESYEYIRTQFEKNKDKIQEYIPILKESGEYKDFTRRLAFDCGWAFIDAQFICKVLYEREGLNDDHIFTAYKRALKDLQLLH